MKQFKKGELAKQILLLTVAGGVVATVCVLPGLAIIFKELDARSSRDRYRVQRSLNALKKQGLLLHEVKNGTERLVLSDTGKEKAWSYLAEDLHIKNQKRWDKKWRVLMFDIPESKGRIRREVSWKIRDIGMKTIQNSVFISPFPCKDEIDKVIQHYNVTKYFIYFEADTIELEQDILQIWNLKK